MKYKLHCLFANRPDLLRQAVEQVRPIGNIHIWPNNGAADPQIPDTTVHMLPPIAPVSAINLMIQSSWDDDVMFWMHNDAFVMPGVAEQFLDAVRNLHQISDERWGVYFTCYDVLCAFNMRAVRDVGYWDPMYFQYTADVDYYHTLHKAGWPSRDFGPGVLHLSGNASAPPEAFAIPPDALPHERARISAMNQGGGSATVQNDSLFNQRVQFRAASGFDKRYYALRWGGPEGAEAYDRPFGTPVR